MARRLTNWHTRDTRHESNIYSKQNSNKSETVRADAILLKVGGNDEMLCLGTKGTVLHGKIISLVSDPLLLSVSTASEQQAAN
jgi:hypothetical protein